MQPKNGISFILKVSFAVLALSFATGFLFADELKNFSHKFHAEQGASCADCHAVDADKPLPSADKCAACHEAPMLGAKPAIQARRLSIAFPHARHAAALECASCHAATAAEEQKAGKPVMGFADCQKCHTENGIELKEKNCLACHKSDPRKDIPADHKIVWKKRHGQESEWRGFGDHGRDCSLCHRDNACTACHRKEQPDTHTGMWRMRTHGKAAAWDDRGCKTCHETGTCIRCHREQKPINHVGNWRFMHGKVGGAFMDNCRVCHTLAEPTCAECHGAKK